MSYRQDVAEAKRLVKRSEEENWRLAELTWQNVKPQGSVTGKQWAEDIGCSNQHVSILARVWGRFGAVNLGLRPGFWDAYTQVKTGGAIQTAGAARVDGGLSAATPAAVAKAIAASPDFQRAVARNKQAREGVEDEAISVRASEPTDMERDPAKFGRKVGHGVAKALDLDEAVAELRHAARSIAQAMVYSEEFGVTDVEGEREALASIKRWLRIYEEKVNVTDDDEAWLADQGITLGGAS